MGKKRRTLLIIGAVLLILVLVFGVKVYRERRLKQAVTASIDAIAALPEPAEGETPNQSLADQILSMADYKVLEVRDGWATIAVISPDLADIFTQRQGSGSGEWSSLEEFEASVEALLDDMEEALQSEDCPMMTTEVDVELGEDGSVIPNYELADALYGGVLTMRDRLTEAYEKGNAE